MFRRFVIALILVSICILALPQAAMSDDARRRHPTPGTGHGQRYEAPRHNYRPYRPDYRYRRPYHHYWSPRSSYTCRVWFRGYWAYDRYGEYWVPSHYGYGLCR